MAHADDSIGQDGLYNLRYRIRGSPEYPVLVEEWYLDRGTLRSLRQIEKQAAIEMGQWGRAGADVEKGKAALEVMLRRIKAGRLRATKEREERNAMEKQLAESPGKLTAPATSPPPHVP